MANVSRLRGKRLTEFQRRLRRFDYDLRWRENDLRVLVESPAGTIVEGSEAIVDSVVGNGDYIAGLVALGLPAGAPSKRKPPIQKR
jgi:hypothetical protein